MPVGYTLGFDDFQTLTLSFTMDDHFPKCGLQTGTALPATKNKTVNRGIKEAAVSILSCFVHSSKLFTFFLGTYRGFERNSSQYEDHKMT